MKKLLSKLSLTFLLFSLIIGNTFFTENVFATENSVSQKKTIQKLCDEFTDLVGYYVFYNLQSKNEQIVFDFSKEEDRRTMLKYSYFEHKKLNKNKQNLLSKQLFGKPISKKVKQIEGNWGYSYPRIEFNKISKINGKKYKAKTTVYEEVTPSTIDEVAKTIKRAEAVVYLKKSSKAKYGYYVTKISIHK